MVLCFVTVDNSIATVWLPLEVTVLLYVSLTACLGSFLEGMRCVDVMLVDYEVCLPYQDSGVPCGKVVVGLLLAICLSVAKNRMRYVTKCIMAMFCQD